MISWHKLAIAHLLPEHFGFASIEIVEEHSFKVFSLRLCDTHFILKVLPWYVEYLTKDQQF